MEHINYILEFGRNISLVFLMLFGLGALIPWIRSRAVFCTDCFLGAGFGVIGMACMLVPVEIAPGVIVDGRIIMAAFGGLYGGGPGAIAGTAVIACFRFFLGGAGWIAGVGTIVTAGAIGFAARKVWRGEMLRIGPVGFMVMGLVLALEIVPWSFVLPVSSREIVFDAKVFPLLLVFPVSTMFFGLIINHELRRHDAELQLLKTQDELEHRIDERTADLENTNAKLMEEIEQRRKVEAELEEGRTYYRLLVERIPDVLFRYDREGRHIFAGDNVHLFSGIPASDYIGRTHRELGYSEEHSRLRLEAVRSVFETGQPCEEEFELDVHKDGRRFYFNRRLFPEYGADGEVSTVFVVSRDVTRRRLAEEALRRSEEAYRELVEESQSIILRMDPEGRITFLNEFGLKFFGFTKEEILDHSITETIVPATDSAGNDVHQVIGELLKDPGKMMYNENENVRKNGERVWVYWANKPVYGATGELVEIMSIGADATDRKEAQDALRKLRRAVEQSPLSIVITDVHGDIEYVNPFFCDATGYSLEEAMGENPRMLKSGVHSDDFYADMWRTISSGDVWRGEICSKKKNGDFFWESASISPVRSKTGTITHYIAVKEDITEKKKTEALQEDVNRIIQHDLKAPINGFINLPELMLSDDNLTGDQRELLEVIRGTGRRMLDMIHLSSDLFRMESGTFLPRTSPVNLVSLLNEVLAEGPGRSAVEITVNGTTPAENAVFTVLGDAGQYASLLMNLVMNALEASPPGHAVAVSMDVDGDEGVFAVRNKGAVPKSVRSSFFDKYITFGKERGTGLGTYTARLIAESNNGSISMATDDENDSTTVTVRFRACPDVDPESGRCLTPPE